MFFVQFQIAAFILVIGVIGTQAFAPHDTETVELKNFEFDNMKLAEMKELKPHFRAEDVDEAKCSEQFGKVKKLFANCMKRGEIIKNRN